MNTAATVNGACRLSLAAPVVRKQQCLEGVSVQGYQLHLLGGLPALLLRFLKMRKYRNSHPCSLFLCIWYGASLFASAGIRNLGLDILGLKHGCCLTKTLDITTPFHGSHPELGRGPRLASAE